MKRSTTNWLMTVVFMLGAVLLAGSPALAGNPACWFDCTAAFMDCNAAAGCWPNECDHGFCDEGKCEDGSYCRPPVSCNNAHCYEERSLCMLGCRDWWFPQLNLVTTLEIPEVVRQEITVELDSLRQEIELGIEQIETALQNRLGNYKEKVKALRQDQTLDEATATSLIGIANRVESTLGKEELIDHIMTEPTH